jgi:RNA polymerase sigma-70 factor (ECF subfamily)
MTVLRLAFFKGDAHSEIARALDLPLGTVKSRIRKAMIKLRLILEPAGGQE